MKRNPYEDMKSLYPPTPAAFTWRISAAVRALPERGARWKLPVPAVAGYAAAAFVTVALILSGFIVPASMPGASRSASAPAGSEATTGAPESSPTATASGTAASSTSDAAASATAGLQTLPPAGPLPTLPITETAAAPTSAEGWQVAAVSGDTTWYYQPSGERLACAAHGKTTTIALDLGSGQTINADTFLPGQDGRWLAFTVREDGGDKVWLVTQDGKKMIVPDDVRWVDYSGNNLVQFDFSNASMMPVGDTHSLYPYNADIPSLIRLKAKFPEGDIYTFQVALNIANGNEDLQFDDRKGSFSIVTKDDSSQPILDSRKHIFFLSKGNDGKTILSLGGRQFKTDLKSENFTFFKMPLDRTRLLYSTHALFIYDNDPERTLWELNLVTGKLKTVASGCVAADWIDENKYWYTIKSDSSTIIKSDKSGLNVVYCEVVLSAGTSSYSSGTGDETTNTTLDVFAVIQNNTKADVTIPNAIPCSLRIRNGNDIIWSRADEIKISDFQHHSVSSASGDISEVENDPIILHPGDILTLNSPEIPCRDSGEYILEGYLYDSNMIISSNSFQSFKRISPTGASFSGKMLTDGRLCVMINNQSRATLLFNNYSSGCYLPPTLRYRLLMGGKIVDTGRLQMTVSLSSDWQNDTVKDRLRSISMALQGIQESNAADDVIISQMNLLPGDTLTLMESSNELKFASLPAGEYTLECCLEYIGQYDSMPWGLDTGYYFDVPFTKK